VTISLEPELLAAIGEARGLIPRSRYIALLLSRVVEKCEEKEAEAEGAEAPHPQEATHTGGDLHGRAM